MNKVNKHKNKMSNFIGLSLNEKSILGRSFTLEILFTYKNTIKEKIDNFKFYRNLKQGKELIDLVLQHFNLYFDIDYLVPVPSHFVENTMRGYETMSYLVYLLSKNLKIDFKPVLRKKFFPLFKRTQKKKSRKARVNSFGRFYIKDASKVFNKNILLIDDVLTTGTSVKELVDLLYFNGAKSVKVLVIALA